MNKIISKKNSLTGWDFKKWFFGNYKTIKELIKVFSPMVLGWIATNSPEATVGITMLGKCILDIAEYYFKEYNA